MRRTAAAAAAAAIVALMAAGGAALASAAESASPAGPFKFARSPALPTVSDATGLSGERLVAARPVVLPGADASGAARLSVRSGGVDRPYLLAPARRGTARGRPALLVVLPAANTTLRTEYDRYGLDALRDHGLTVLVAGTYAASWNAGACCGRPQREGVDEVAALVAMRDDAVRRSGADPARVAVVGHSVGAMMAWRLACTPAFGAAAVVAVSGTLVHPCPTRLARTPRVLVLNGDLDSTVPVDGSDRVVTVLGVAPPSVRDAVRLLATSGACGAPVVRRDAGTVTDRTGCTGGGTVRFHVVEGVGHPWAGLQATRRLGAFLDEAVTGVR